ncbi:hypothetical protein HZA56_22920 [Candidatus Poribacteria bacterium]|nr:hypothetical protein [Candidatus Poribacteria bacterium]
MVDYKNKIGGALACASIACACFSWALGWILYSGQDTFRFEVSLSVASILLGIIALRLLNKNAKLIRRAAWVGVFGGAAKLIVIIFSFIALLLAFRKNPVAH